MLEEINKEKETIVQQLVLERIIILRNYRYTSHPSIIHIGNNWTNVITRETYTNENIIEKLSNGWRVISTNKSFANDDNDDENLGVETIIIEKTTKI